MSYKDLIMQNNLTIKSLFFLSIILSIGNNNVSAQSLGGNGTNTPSIGTLTPPGGGSLENPPIFITANQAISSMNIGATVSSNCTIQASNVSFGIYDSTKGDTTPIQVNFNYMCTKDVSVSLRLNGGNKFDGTDRYMTNSDDSAKLKYKLTQQSSTIGIPINTNFLTELATGMQVNKAISAYIVGNQSVPPGNYSDNLLLTLEY